MFSKKNIVFAVFSLTLGLPFVYGQQGELTINQDQKIATLLDYKKQLNSTENSPNRYKIQIYSGGSRTQAENSRSRFLHRFAQWPTSLEYSEPNYKIWIGSFRTQLEADRALKKIKQKFSNAFIFKPKKKRH